MTPPLNKTHSPAFRVGLSSIVRGDVIIPVLRSYLTDPEFKGFHIDVHGLGGRDPDGWFHPSEHPRWPLRALWLYLVVPSLIEREPLDPSALMAMTVGSVWHAIIERCLLDLDVLISNEVKLEHLPTKTRGKADGLLRTNELFELKGLALDTPLPTPDGWTTMGAVSVGDSLISGDGIPCTVLETSVPRVTPGRRVHFDDGTSIVCDADHRWPVESGQPGRMSSSLMTTDEIASSLVGSNGQSQHRIVNSPPVAMNERVLPIDPYVLGAWIGDGSKSNGAITQGANSGIWGEFEKCGYRVGPVWGGGEQGTRTLYGLRTQLIAAKMLGVKKHIPVAYMRASVSQRLSLLQGLMDTDGTWSPLRKNAVFTSVDPDLAEQVRELVVSLGMRCRIQEVTARGFGVETQAFHVVFRPYRLNPFRMKASQVQCGDAVRSGRRVIQRIEDIGDIVTKCVMVDSSDHTYLCGPQMVPTHNSMKDQRLRKIETVQDFIEMYPDYHLQAQEYMRMSGIHRMRFLLLALTFPFEMKEFVVEYDHAIAYRTESKYAQAIQMAADGDVPMCDGCAPKTFCPARSVCQTATGDQLKAWMKGAS